MTRGQAEKTPGWSFALGVLALLALIAVLAQGLRGRPAPGSAPASQAAQDIPTTQVPGAKETFIAQEAIAGATEQARLILTPSPGPGTFKPVSDDTPEPVISMATRQPAGAGTIIWNIETPLDKAGYQITGSMWVEDKETGVIEVYAGAERNDFNNWNDPPPQGMVLVLDETPGGISGGYKTPTQLGPIQIINAQGERLILQTLNRSNRVTFYFDIPSRQFVDSLTVTVTPSPPTATPAPSAYP